MNPLQGLIHEHRTVFLLLLTFYVFTVVYEGYCFCTEIKDVISEDDEIASTEEGILILGCIITILLLPFIAPFTFIGDRLKK